MYKGLCVGGVVPLVRLDVGCVLVSVYIDADDLEIAALMGSYDGFFRIFFVIFVVWMRGCLYCKW